VIYEDYADTIGNTALALSIILLLIAAVFILLYSICYRRFPSPNAVAPEINERQLNTSVKSPIDHPGPNAEPIVAPAQPPISSSVTQPKNTFEVANPVAPTPTKPHPSQQQNELKFKNSKTNKANNPQKLRKN